MSAFKEAILSIATQIEACATVQNLSVTKRMGYFAELSSKEILQELITYAESPAKQIQSP